jgi:hypothetical protein
MLSASARTIISIFSCSATISIILLSALLSLLPIFLSTTNSSILRFIDPISPSTELNFSRISSSCANPNFPERSNIRIRDSLSVNSSIRTSCRLSVWKVFQCIVIMFFLECQLSLGTFREL